MVLDIGDVEKRKLDGRVNGTYREYKCSLILLYVFFFSSRRRHKNLEFFFWARKWVKGTGKAPQTKKKIIIVDYFFFFGLDIGI